LSVFQVNSSIISSLNATPVVYCRHQLVVLSFHNFQNNEIFMKKTRPIVPAWVRVQWATGWDTTNIL